MSKRIPIALVAAVAQNGVIGMDGGMPWRLSSDLKRFKRDTMGKPVIMGRRTFQSIGKPLPGRLNLVVSRSGFSADGIETFDTLEAAIDRAAEWARQNDAEEICIIGGGQIYRESVGQADRLYITHVLAEPKGDTHFPEIEQSEWRPVSRESVPKGDKDEAETLYAIYERFE